MGFARITGVATGLVALLIFVTAFAQNQGRNAVPPVGKADPVAKALESQRDLFEGTPACTDAKNAYQFSFDGLMLDRIPFRAFAGKPILVVNTASKCGFTGQYADLQTLYTRYRTEGLVIVGVPSNDFGGQEPGSEEEIATFCKLNFGVTFPMAAKHVVSGGDAHPFYQWAKTALGEAAVPKWNFHKILIGRDGEPAAAFPSGVAPMAGPLTRAIEMALARPASEAGSMCAR